MKNPFLIDKSYRIRHKILGVLYNDWKAHNREYNRIVGSIQISNQTNLLPDDIHEWQNLLVNESEIATSDNDGQVMMSIQQKGISAYIDKRYLKEGRENKLDGIWNWARIVIPLGTLILSGYNYYVNKGLNTKIKELEVKIAQFKK